MEHKTRTKGLSALLSLAMLLSLIPAISIPARAADQTVNLSTLTENYTTKTGDTLTGELSGKYKITVSGTVTFDNVTINGTNDANCKWAGITCSGISSTIIIKGKNTIRGFHEDYPGIQVGSSSYTLTIKGGGSLTASSNGKGAGIGSLAGGTCGNIVIEGGTITATGGENAPGIGGKNGKITINGGAVTAIGGKNAAAIGGGNNELFRDITINNGTVVAKGGENAAGIGSGSGNTASCGKITISADVDATGGENAAAIGNGKGGTCGDITFSAGKLTATKGNYAEYSIGTGENGGTVTVLGTEGAVSDSPYTTAATDKDLSTLTENYSAKGGEYLTGTLAGNYKISIGSGTAVTLKNVTINGVNDGENYPWAGITCEGNATLILEGENTVKGFHRYYPGIYVPEGSTLTIKGDGSLNASSNGNGAGIGAGHYEINCGNIIIESGTIIATGGSDSVGGSAGIGGSYQSTCGDITITGGTITATSKNNGAGIGGGGQNGTCGDITITGGTVTATGNTTGIGSGMSSNCGDITIDNALVTATGGAQYGAGIGSSYKGTCGNISISGGKVTAKGGAGSAGIGGGYYGTCGNITITGENTSLEVTKGTGKNSMSIGTGHAKSTCGTVTVFETVGTVSASPFVYSPVTPPTISVQPENKELTYGYTEGSISVAATAAEGHTITGYQWYANTTNSNEGGTVIENATAASYTIPIGKSTGSKEYYYCVVTATRTEDSQKAEATSAAAMVTVVKANAAAATLTPGNRTYNGAEQPLVIVTGEADGGTMWYAVGENGTDAPEFDGTSEVENKKWTTSVPNGTDIGIYYVWYKVVGDENHNDSEPTCVRVTISRRSSGGSSGSSSAPASYAPTVSSASNGTVSVNPTSPKSGDKVTITAKPSTGYAVDTVTVTDATGKAVAVAKNSDGTYTFTQPSSKVKINTTFKAADTATTATDALAAFSDVQASAWYADAVRWALDNGVMNGVSSKHFSPNDNTSRAMIVTMLWRMEGSPAYVGTSEYADVNNENWYGQAVRWASAEGIVKGYRDANGRGMVFNPDTAVSREQLATMLYRYAQYKKQDVSVGEDTNLVRYGDAQTVSSWATSTMQWAVGSGIINGIGSDLVPAGNATRAQVATMLMRYSTAK